MEALFNSVRILAREGSFCFPVARSDCKLGSSTTDLMSDISCFCCPGEAADAASELLDVQTNKTSILSGGPGGREPGPPEDCIIAYSSPSVMAL